MALYNFEKRGRKKVLVWNKGRKRGVKEAEGRIGGILKEVNVLLKKKDKIRILEIGCGYGRALLELRKFFGDRVEVHGINFERRWNLRLIKKFGVSQKIFVIKGIEKNLPKLYILDAGQKMKFPSNYFDFIFSQATGQYIADKALFLEEINRLLKKDGIAKIDVQHRKPIFPGHPEHPDEYKNLFEIWDNGKRLDFINYIKKFKNIQVRKARDSPFSYLVIKKSKNFKLNLKLVVHFDLNKIHKEWWGEKAVFVLKR